VPVDGRGLVHAGLGEVVDDVDLEVVALATSDEWPGIDASREDGTEKKLSK
jgi:hypothetical protein